MRYVVLIMMALFLTCAVAADNTQPTANQVRVNELAAAQQRIVVEINVAQDQAAQIQQFIEGKRMELYKLQGAIEELQRQDAIAAQKAKDDKPDVE